MVGKVKHLAAAIGFALVMLFTPAFFAVLPSAALAQNNPPAAGGQPAAPAPAANQPAAGAQAPAAQTPPPQQQGQDAGWIQTFANTVVNFMLLSVGSILLEIMNLLAYFFSLAIEVLRWSISYNSFATQSEVAVGWALVRDIINSFFIVVLIAIAISTIIRFQQYNFRSTLPRLIVAALLVNFSKTICLLGISFANSVMNTFATQLMQILPVYALGLRLPALTALGGESVGSVFGAVSWQNVDKKPVEVVTIIVSLLAAIVMMVFALGGLVMFCIILLFRILVLWFLMILSPLAFFLWGAPGRAASYWGQWLEEYVKHVIIGPIGAFFLYIIAFFMVQNLQSSYGFSAALPPATPTIATHPRVFVGYLISLGMMFIALEIIEQFGVRGGQFARNIGVDKIIKGTGRLAASTGAHINDYLYSKGLSVKPLEAYNKMREGISARRANWVREGDEVMARRVADAEGRRAGLTAAAWATLSGNEQFWEKNGSWQLIKRAVAAPGVTAMQAAQAARRGVGYLRGGTVGADLRGGVSSRIQAAREGIAGLPGAMADKLRSTWAMGGDTDQMDAEMQKVNERLKMGKAFANVGSGYDNHTGASIGALKANVDRYRGLQKRMSENDAAALQEMVDWENSGDPNFAQVKSEAENPDSRIDAAAELASNLEKNGALAAGQRLADARSALDTSRSSDEARVRTLSTEIATRINASQVAMSAVKADLVIKAQEARSKMFKQFEEYGPEILANFLQGHLNPSDVPEAMAVIMEAAKQDNLPDVVEKLNISGVSLRDHDGIKNFANMLKDRLKVDDATVAEILVTAQAYTSKHGDFAAGAMAKRDHRGRAQLMDKKDYSGAVQKSVRGAGISSVIKAKPAKLGLVRKGADNKDVIDLFPDVREAILSDVEGINRVFSSPIRGEAKTPIVNAIREAVKKDPNIANQISPQAKRNLGL